MGFFIETRSLCIGIVVGAAAGSAATIVCYRRDLIPAKILGQRRSPTPLPSEKPPERATPPLEAHYKHPALKYGTMHNLIMNALGIWRYVGIPSPGFGSQNLRFFDGFVAAFDSRTRNPSWVLEHLVWCENTAEEADRHRSLFTEDEAIDKKFRNKLDDFRDSGYDRGHLAAAANHKRSQKAMDETFTLTNISPQVGAGFNRDYWARFEKFSRNLAKISAAVFIATGPLWLPEKESEGKYVMKYPMIGHPPALISVPTHFYKVILVEPKDLVTDGENAPIGDCSLAAFVMPNRSIPQDVPLQRFAVPISDLEGATGMTFFPKYMNEEKRSQLDVSALFWRSIGKALHGKSSGSVLQMLDDSESREKSPASSEIKKIKKRGLGLLTAKRCALEPHLCYHTECVLPPPEFWKKPADRQVSSAKKKP